EGRGAGCDAETFEAVMYEGYGPGGVAFLVEALTDNRNRTGSEVRHLFSKHGGSLGEPGSVAWQFEKKGVVVVSAEKYSEDDLMVAIDAGAEDVVQDETVWEIVTDQADLQAVRSALEGEGVEIEAADLTMRPTTTIDLDEDQVGKVLKLVEALDDQDDVNAVHANFEADAEVLERAAAA